MRISVPFLVLSVFVLSACGSTTVQLTSQPEGANVFLKPLGSGSQKNVGVTPQTLNLDELAGELGGSGPIWVELTKDGYTKTRVLLTDMLGTDVSISVDLEEIPGFFNQDIANEVVGSLFTAQKHIRNKQYKEAEEIIKKIKEKSPNIAAVYELEGGSLFVQSKRKESLDAYKQAFKINPKNVDTKRMIDLLEKNLGGKP